MNRHDIIATIWLTGAAVLGPGTANAQPHMPPPAAEEQAEPPVEPEVWLRRLAGRFRFEGLVNVVAKGDCPGTFCEGIKGTGDCVAIGPGAGVQCVLSVEWLDIREEVQPSSEEKGGIYNVPGGISYLNPAMSLYGLDPGKAAINYLLVDNKGLPEGGLGSNTATRATFKTACVNAPVLLAAMRPPARGQPQWRTCDRIIRIDAKPDAKVVFMTIDIDINEDVFTRFTLALRRVE